MAAILFLFVTFSLLLAGRAQVHATEYGSEPLLRFKVWQLALAAFAPLLWVLQVATTARLIVFAAAAAMFARSALNAEHAHDVDDLHF